MRTSQRYIIQERMSEIEKSFTCSSPGCTMSFTNEDYLAVHKKKHDMVLNLCTNGKSTIFVADQTPTPTRFIRNCEEVGLFQDLQNVNPFEETFRRAVESGNTGTLTVSETGISDDTLHTPHIFPHIADVLSASSQILDESNIGECSTTITVTDKILDEKSPVLPLCTGEKLFPCDSHNVMKDVKLAISKHCSLTHERTVTQDTTISQSKIISSQLSPQLSINGEEVQLLLKTADGKIMQLMATPVSEQNTTNNQTIVIKTQPSLTCSTKTDVKKAAVSRLSLAKMKLKQVLAKNGTAQNQKMSDNFITDTLVTSFKKVAHNKIMDQHKKKDMQERNRASSMRARAKRKAWIQQLERNVSNVNETNSALQMEVKALRSEVAKLKGLLLAHKDCPVTKAMQKGNGIVLGHKIITVNPDMVTVPIPINTPPIKRTSLLQSDPLSKSKRKRPTAPKKTPIIFPKIDCNIAPVQSATLVKGLSTIKILDVGQFLREGEEVKPILIVQNPVKKIGNTSPRQIIQINPNCEVEHAASKSTGS